METLIIKYLTGEATETESASLKEWLAASEENSKEFSRIKKIFDATGVYYNKSPLQSPTIDVDREWQHFQDNHINKESRVVSLSPTRSWLRIAASVALVAVSACIILRLVNKQQDMVWTTDGASLSVLLPDGSKAILNAHSTLTASAEYGKGLRKLKLAGEAFFDVVHDAAVPFVVESNHTLVEDIGTAFDIRAYPGDHSVEVTVEKGIVRFSAPDAKKESTLSAGQAASFESTKGIITTSTLSPNYNAWKTGKLTFDNADLTTVIETLNKTYNSNIVVTTPALPSCVVTVSFEKQTLDSVLRVLETTLNLTIVRTGNKIEITHAGC